MCILTAHCQKKKKITQKSVHIFPVCVAQNGSQTPLRSHKPQNFLGGLTAPPNPQLQLLASLAWWTPTFQFLAKTVLSDNLFVLTPVLSNAENNS